MITLHHLAVSQSDRIVWILEELDIPYTLKWYDRNADGLAPDEYRALHPVGTAPIIEDGDLVLSESAAIVEYISQRYGNGSLSVSPDQENYPHYLYWMQFNANVQSVFFAKMLASQLQTDKTTDNKKEDLGSAVMQRREDGYYTFLNTRLGEAPYLAGESLSCADIMAMFNLTSLPLYGARKIDDLPNVAAYVERISKRPAYIKAMEIAGPQAKRPA